MLNGKWTSSEAKAFQEAQDLLTSFNPSQKLTLMCKASPYGVGAVLSQIPKHFSMSDKPSYS